jgi:hypothetical protein
MPLFTIRGLMVAIAVVAVALGLLLNHPLTSIAGLYAVGLAFVAWLPSRGRSRVAAWGFFLSSAWLNLSMLALFAWYPVFHNATLILMLSLPFVAVVPGFGLAWVASHLRRRRRIGAAVAVIAAVALPCSIIADRWPFRLAFYLSSADLNRMADRVEAGGTIRPGEWAGLYRVWGASVDPNSGDPILVIDPDPAGIFAFTRHRNAPPPHPVPGDRFEGGRWDCIDQD